MTLPALPWLLAPLLASTGALSSELPPCSPGPEKLRPVVEKQNGRKVSEGNLRGAARDGRWVFYWPTGHKKEQSHYCNGTRHGPVTFWYDDGLPELEGTFNMGVPWDTWTFRTRTGARRTFRPVPKKREHGFFLDEGNRALAREELELASSLLNIALRNAHRPAEVHRSLGVLHAKKGEGARAAFHYRRYIELAPDAPDRPTVERMLAAYEASRQAARSDPAAVTAQAPSTNGHSSNGRSSNGHSSNGHSSNGHSSNGHTGNGQTAGLPTVATTAAPSPDLPRAGPVEEVVRLEVVTLPAASVVVDGVRHPYLTPLDGPRALRLKPGKHQLQLEVMTDPATVQHMEVTVTADDPANRVEFVPGERLTTYGAVQIRPLPPPE